MTRWLRFLRKAWEQVRLIMGEAFVSFLRNDDLRQASGLAFYTTLALIPTLLLLTYSLTLSIGSSQKATLWMHGFVEDMIPQFSEVILQEVDVLSGKFGALGMVNVLLLLWSLVPLVGSLRSILDSILKRPSSRPFWALKLLDLLTAVLFVLGTAMVAGLGVIQNGLPWLKVALEVPIGLELLISMGGIFLLVSFLFYSLTSKVRPVHLLLAALLTTLIWFMLRPAFSLFLAYNPGYGLTFGGFKSIFIVILWIYYSQAVLLFGAEVLGALERKQLLLVRRLVAGKRNFQTQQMERYLLHLTPGEILFHENEQGNSMYYLVQGSIAVFQGEIELARIEPGRYFGEMSFLLGQTRTATAKAMEPCECIRVDQDTFEALMQDSPETIQGMLREMALRLREANRKLQNPLHPE